MLQPPNPASWADYDSRAGVAERLTSATSQRSIDNCCSWFLPFTCGEQTGKKTSYCKFLVSMQEQ